MQRKYWDNGYVKEAGEKILKDAFERCGLEEIVYFSSIHNHQGEKMVEALGMQKSDENFNHPFVELGHNLSEHYLYKIRNINLI